MVKTAAFEKKRKQKRNFENMITAFENNPFENNQNCF